MKPFQRHLTWSESSDSSHFIWKHGDLKEKITPWRVRSFPWTASLVIRDQQRRSNGAVVRSGITAVVPGTLSNFPRYWGNWSQVMKLWDPDRSRYVGGLWVPYHTEDSWGHKDFVREKKGIVWSTKKQGSKCGLLPLAWSCVNTGLV